MKIGMSFSLSGAQAEMEKSILDGALLAVHEINAAGGTRGRELEYAVFDDQSEVSLSVRGIDHLCQDEGADVIVGGYTSASRLVMIPAIHANRSLLLYPTYFEGEETDDRVFYCGAAPNQFLTDYIAWIAENLGRQIFIVGSDYIYPRVLAEAIRRLGMHWDVETVGTAYAPLQETSFSAVVREIKRAKPSVIISNLVGTDSTVAFYTQMHDAGFDATTMPIAATVTTAVDLAHMPRGIGNGHYMVGSYLAAIDNAANRRYRQGLLEVRDQPLAHAAQVGAYNAVHAVHLAAEAVTTLERGDLSAALLGVRFDDNPEGLPFWFRSNHFSAHPSYVGRAVDGDYEVVAEFSPRLPQPWWSRRVSLAG